MLISNLHNGVVEAGCDEAGRGPLAGPVFAAAVILPPGFENVMLNDSKKLTAKRRYMLREIIMNEAVAWAVASVSPTVIDRINILNASYKAMCEAVRQLSAKPEMLLIDGNRFRGDDDIPFECIVKGDGKIASIAAASVLAKTFRDDYMVMLAERYPQYGWDKNYGYPTADHMHAIMEFGLTPHHRRSYAPCAPTIPGIFD
ncbi:MAG: ribonuclease HII [Rikenellaceae bacterium]|nr:ribonuclease HII [Rikenellaceae bacterium]